MRDYYFEIADFIVRLRLSDDKDMGRLLPSFRPFVCDGTGNGQSDCLLEAMVDSLSGVPPVQKDRLLEEDRNDMGYIRLYQNGNQYLVEIQSADELPCHYMTADKLFRSVRIYVDWSDWTVGAVLSSMLRIAYSQAILPHQGVSIHASAVCWNGQSYLFMGKSGTGKSTHSALWIKYFEGCELLNDDNPVVRILGDKVMAYGTPWSGKTPCYRNLGFPVGGMVRLYQSEVNRYEVCQNIDAFVTLLPGCSVIAKDKVLYNSLCDTVALLSEMVKVGVLYCLPDRNAAELCRQFLQK